MAKAICLICQANTFYSMFMYSRLYGKSVAAVVCNDCLKSPKYISELKSAINALEKRLKTGD